MTTPNSPVGADARLRSLVLPDQDVARDLRRAARLLVFDAFGDRFSRDDWAHTGGGWRILLLEDDTPVGHAAVVGRRLQIGSESWEAGYVEGVATRPDRQREGIGSTVMSLVAEVVRAHFQLGALSTSHHALYRRLGWERWAGPSFVRGADALVRTPDEDSGLMVLRFGPTETVALANGIICEPRSGDDW